MLFFREVLRFEPDPWQRNAAMDLADAPRVSIRSGQGVGKTGFEAACLLWFLCCFPYPRIVATAPTRQQLNDVLWSEVAKWQEKSPLLRRILKWTKTYIYMVGYEKRWFAVARTATKPENMQGFHEDNMLFIVDEASGVADPIMEAVFGTLSGENNKLLMCGNPTKKSGFFYDSHTSSRALYRCHVVNSQDSPRTSKENIEALIKKYGAESNVVRVRVYGEFPKQEDDVFIPIEMCEGSANVDVTVDDLKETGIDRIDIGCDVARYGSDETVIASRAGSYLYPLKIRLGQSLMKTVGDLLAEAYRLHEEWLGYDGYIYLKVDDTGLGGGVSDRLEEIKKERWLDWLVVVPVNFAASVRHIKAARYYADITTYMWAIARDLMEKEEVRIPNDAELIAQFSVRKYFMLSGGKMQLESKDDMKKRDIKSPDRADAVALCLLPVNKKKST